MKIAPIVKIPVLATATQKQIFEMKEKLAAAYNCYPRLGRYIDTFI